jgi:hypothetical protein
MNGVRAALYVDFDNVFGGLLKLDPAAAMAFVDDPASWLQRLSTSLTVDGPRSWRVLRCYLNSAGSVADPRGGEHRLLFSGLRSTFLHAGFEVVDCPPFFTGSKNAADIRIVLDAMDALHGPTPYDEFVIASADADFTPLLVRLRAADRRTTLISTIDAAAALAALADRYVDGLQVLALLRRDAADVGRHRAAEPPEVERARAAFARLAKARLLSATAPLSLADLGETIHRELGPTVKGSKWFGQRTITGALKSLDLPNLAISTHHVWDSSRHKKPAR